MASRQTTITNDLRIDSAKFEAIAVSEETVKAKTVLEHITTTGAKWYTVGAETYRKMRDEGKTALPPPVYLPAAQDIEIPSRNEGRNIPVRIYEPENGLPSRGIIMHCHGGGFVLSTHKQSDSALEKYANACQLTAVSVGYRLAPEHPFPAATNDCIDVAQYLVDHGEERFGQRLRFLVGHSAGSCLAAVTVFALMRSRPQHQLAGFLSHFGQFDVTLGLPYVSSYNKPLMINARELRHFADAYTPGMTPLYEDMQSLAAALPTAALPPAVFHIGTDDPLLDDNILMSAKWQMTGSEGILKIYPGEPHGFTLLGGNAATDCAAVDVRFVSERLASLEDQDSNGK